jgi:bacillithiol system protein YtxJ
MQAEFFKITDIALLEKGILRSHSEPVIIYKHSDSCSISSAAYEQMKKIDGSINLIVVQTARDVSDEIESRFGIQHESPQTIILRNGKVVWSASHLAISAGSVEDARLRFC